MRPAIILCPLVLLLGVTCVSAEPVKISGVVSITEDADWHITAVKLTTADNSVYNVVLDDVGRRLGAENNGDTVEVTATVSTKDDAKWLTVTDFKEIEK